MQLDSSETCGLIDRFRRGETDCFGTLLERHREFLMRVVTLRISDKLRTRIDPSDIVQEANVEAYRRADEYLQESKLSFRLWLRRITYDRLVSAWRQHGGAAKRSVEQEVRLPEESSILLARALVSDGASPLERFNQREVADGVRRAIAGLAERDREIILLHNFEGFTSEQSAEILEIEPATARQRYGRALLRLRQRLIDDGLAETQS